MAHKRKSNTTKLEIIQVASRMFLEQGYSKTTIKSIADELDISTGHLMFYFPTKDHLLSVLVETLCEFQWKLVQEVVNEGTTSVMALCLELATMAASSDENEVLREFFLASYSSPSTLEIIRKNDAERAKVVFSDYCKDWSDANFAEAEILVSGIEYATLMPAGDPVPLETRVAGAVNNILTIYNVPEDIRRTKLEKLDALDCRSIGKRVFKEFKQYVEEANEQAFAEALGG